jgi:hypothetical protein
MTAILSTHYIHPDTFRIIRFGKLVATMGKAQATV